MPSAIRLGWNLLKVREQGTLGQYDLDPLYEGINSEDVLKLSYKGKLVTQFGEEGTEYTLEEAPFETRCLTTETLGRYVAHDVLNGTNAFADSFEPDETKWAGAYTYNDGKFPYMLNPYKYLVLYNSRNAMLLELFPTENWTIFAHQDFDEGTLFDYLDDEKPLIDVSDILTDENGVSSKFESQELCQWVIQYPVKKSSEVYTIQTVSRD